MSSEPLKPPFPSEDDDPDLPEDGPRYHEEATSAALLRSAHRPFDEWNGHECPDCRSEFLTFDGIAAHWTDLHSDGRWEVTNVDE